MLNLTQLPDFYLKKYGKDRVAEILGKSPGIVAAWASANKFSLASVQKLVEFDPEPMNGAAKATLPVIEDAPDVPAPQEPQYLYEPIATGNKLCILVPLTGAPQPKMMDSIMGLYDKREMGYKRRAFNTLSVVRNSLAAHGLRGGYEWFYWADADNVVPWGDAAAYKESIGVPDMPEPFAGLHTIYRLLAHKLKRGVDARIVSVCYIARERGGAPQFGGGEGQMMRTRVRTGPKDELIEVPWVPFGGCLTHRSVFEDIIASQGDEIRMRPDGIGARFGYEYAFFHPIDRETPGDDIPFCIRAARAGHKFYVDLAVMAGHGIGDKIFTYKDA